MSFLLFDVGLPGGTTTLIAGIGLFFIIAAAAYVMFRIMRKTVKMAFRMAMVVTVLFTFVVGGAALYWFGMGTASKTTRPEKSRPR
jgi:tetrahydromethanopterin S-methyltransferase subunit D